MQIFPFLLCSENHLYRFTNFSPNTNQFNWKILKEAREVNSCDLYLTNFLKFAGKTEKRYGNPNNNTYYPDKTPTQYLPNTYQTCFCSANQFVLARCSTLPPNKEFHNMIYQNKLFNFFRNTLFMNALSSVHLGHLKLISYLGLLQTSDMGHVTVWACSLCCLLLPTCLL
jgi:hypothetical protein